MVKRPRVSDVLRVGEIRIEQAPDAVVLPWKLVRELVSAPSIGQSYNPAFRSDSSGLGAGSLRERGDHQPIRRHAAQDPQV